MGGRNIPELFNSIFHFGVDVMRIHSFITRKMKYLLFAKKKNFFGFCISRCSFSDNMIEIFTVLLFFFLVSTKALLSKGSCRDKYISRTYSDS